MYCGSLKAYSPVKYGQSGADGVARLKTLAIDQQAACAQIATALDFDGG